MPEPLNTSLNMPESSPDTHQEVAEPTTASEAIEQAYSSAFFNGPEFLNKVPEQDRPIVAKYLQPVMQEWDGGLTKKFQTHQEEIKRWKELGEYEELQRAKQIVNHFRTNGEKVFADMFKGWVETYGPEAIPKLQQLVYGEQQAPEMTDYQYGNGEFDEEESGPDDVWRNNIEQTVQQQQEMLQRFQEAEQERVAAEALDNVWNQVHTEHPDIPEWFFLQGIAAGVGPQDIINKFGELTQGIGSQQNSRPNPPVVMGGGQGGIPSGQVDAAKLDKKGRQALAEQWLAAAQQQ